MGYDSAVLPLGPLFLVPLLSRSHFGTSFNLVFLFWGSNPTLRQRTPLAALWQPEAPEMVMMMGLQNRSAGTPIDDDDDDDGGDDDDDGDDGV